MGWFSSVKNPKLKNAKKQTSNTPSGLWKKCIGCGEILQTQKLDFNNQVCPFCDHHYRLRAHERIDLLCDRGSFNEVAQNLATSDPLEFNDRHTYKDRLQKAKKVTGRNDGTLVGSAKIDGRPVALAVMDFHFMGGSMGVVTGEKNCAGDGNGP